MSRVLPILFNTDMVRAILGGRKTVTRRICKDANELTVPDMSFYDAEKRTYAVHNYSNKEHTDKLSIAERTCPICPGDILYVRETWNHYVYDIVAGSEKGFHKEGYFYKASPEMKSELPDYVQYHYGEIWKPSIHMPKEAARIWLKVNDVRVERLKDMTDKDALKEGAQGVECDHAGLGAYGCTDCMNTGWLEPPILEFMEIWNSTIKKSELDRYGWGANPLVWVIEFERCEKPENW